MFRFRLRNGYLKRLRLVLLPTAIYLLNNGVQTRNQGDIRSFIRDRELLCVYQVLNIFSVTKKSRQARTTSLGLLQIIAMVLQLQGKRAS